MKANELQKTTPNPIEKAQVLSELSLKAKKLRDELSVVEKQMRPLRDELLQITQDLDVYTLKTGKYTISRVARYYPEVEDFKTLKETLDREGVPYETQESFTPQTEFMFKEAIKAGKHFEGLNEGKTEYIMIRTKGGDSDE